jgi:uncharacterized repeat protein (TIGR03803 family)
MEAQPVEVSAASLHGLPGVTGSKKLSGQDTRLTMKRNRMMPASILSLAIIAFSLVGSPTWAQSFDVIYNFQNSPDGAQPVAGVTFDRQGNLYGTTQRGGILQCPLSGCGTVFLLVPNAGSWTEQVLTRFETQGSYGGAPETPVVFDRLGNVYGTFVCAFDCFGGHGGGVFELLHSDGLWRDRTLASYWSQGQDQCDPCGVAFDSVGRLYGVTTSYESQYGNTGAVFQLGQQSVFGWYTVILYIFHGGIDGVNPSPWFTFDSNGAIYGTTEFGSDNNAGTVFQLQNRGGAQWTETQPWVFHGGSVDGAYPTLGVIFDSAGNLYGTTSQGGTANKGTVFKLTHNSGGSWTESILYSFQGGTDAATPSGPLIFDVHGNLYGVAAGGMFGYGSVYKLTPSSGGQWIESVVYSFTGGLDGGYPSGELALDSSGNLYGTTARGGAHPDCSDEPNCGGVVYEISP